MKMKKILIAAGILAVSSVLFASGCGQRFCGGPKDQARMFERIDHEVADLKLTDTQQKKYNEIRDRIRSDMDTALKDRGGKEKLIHDELEKDKPDMAKIAAIAKTFSKERPEFMEKHIDAFVEFYNTLNDSQKAQVVEKLRKAEKHMGGRGPRK